MGIGDLFHRRNKSSTDEKKHRKSLSQSSERRDSRESIPYETTSPSRAPVIGKSPLHGSDQSPRQSDHPLAASPGGRRPPQGIDSSLQQSSRAPATAVANGQPQYGSTQLENGMQQLNLQSSPASPTSPTERGYPRQQPPPVPPHTSPQPLFHRRDPYAEEVADANIAHNAEPHAITRDAPAPLNIDRRSKHAHTSSTASSGRGPLSPAYDSPVSPPIGSARSSRGQRGSISRKPLDEDARVADISSAVSRAAQTHPSDMPPAGRSPVVRRRSSREDLSADIDNRETAQSRDMYDDRARQNMLVSNAPTAPSLQGVVDLSNTVDTTVHETWAPAVTREVVHKHYHNIREEVITRQVHTHDVYHRIQPIIDIQVLPTRHFVLHPTTGEKIEIAEDQVPGRAGQNADWVIAETVTKMNPADGVLKEPTRFSARQFGPGEGDTRQWIEEDGTRKSERTWIHHPELDTGAQLSGQSVPFHFGHEREEMNGIRPDLS